MASQPITHSHSFFPWDDRINSQFNSLVFLLQVNLARLELQVAAAKVEPSEAAQDLADLEGMFSDLAVTKDEGKEELKTTMEKLRRQVDNMVIAAGPKKEERYVSS